jgi:hypothetical protein
MMRGVAIAVLTTFVATSTKACQLAEEDVYDDLSSDNFALVIADVTDLTITKSGDTNSCFAVDYRRKDMLQGDLPAEFRVETCGDDGPITLEDFARSAEEIGFAIGATVLVGVMPSETGTVGLRHAVPDCWGPLHLRLDLLGETEREVLMAYFRDMLSGAAEAP